MKRQNQYAQIILSEPSFDEALSQAWFKFPDIQHVVLMGYGNPFADVYVYNFQFEFKEQVDELICRHCKTGKVFHIAADNYSDRHWQCEDCCSTFPIWLYPVEE